MGMGFHMFLIKQLYSKKPSIYDGRSDLVNSYKRSDRMLYKTFYRQEIRSRLLQKLFLIRHALKFTILGSTRCAGTS